MLGGCAEVIEWRRRQSGYNIRVLVKTVSSSIDFRKIATLGRVCVKPIRIAQQMHIMKCLFGVSIVSSNFILSVLRNADGRQDADDGNYDQQFYECETGCTFMS